MVKNNYHNPVLLQEMLSLLITNRDGIYVDGTLGGGGYSEAIIRQLSPRGMVVGIDQDINAIDHVKKKAGMLGGKLHLIHNAFGNIDQILSDLGIATIDGLVLDLGVSSAQIDQEARGFSYLNEGRLDMRMDERQSVSARDVVNTYPESRLADIFYYYGEERRSRQIARRLVEARTQHPVESTLALADLIRSRTPYSQQIKTLSRIFQAIRIEVNDELGQLKEMLEKGYAVLKSGGRMVIVSYHSLEARLVKRFFKGQPLEFQKGEVSEEQTAYHFKLLTRKAVFPSAEEIALNPRARSAMLRAAEKSQPSQFR